MPLRISRVSSDSPFARVPSYGSPVSPIDGVLRSQKDSALTNANTKQVHGYSTTSARGRNQPWNSCEKFNDETAGCRRTCNVLSLSRVLAVGSESRFAFSLSLCVQPANISVFLNCAAEPDCATQIHPYFFANRHQDASEGGKDFGGERGERG